MGNRTPGASATRSVARGVTTALRYALMLVIVTILVSGLFLGVSEFVETQQERAIGSQLDTAGNRLAGNLATASHLVATGEASTRVELETPLPETVASSAYFVEITQLESGPRYEYRLTLRSVEPAVEASVVVRTTARIKEDTVRGGPLAIEYDDSDSEPVVVRRA